MADAYVVRPTDGKPDELDHPLKEIKKVVSVKCPLCEYKVRIYYLEVQEHFIDEDIKHYKKELEIEHKRLNGHRIKK
ncbi:MAG TPA: hypothetical protein G4N92_08350 [Anaerolineae bacterium]|nr:hypothetical protein [Anaerolineae bacterium]